MPNHVRHIMTVDGDQRQFQEFIGGAEEADSFILAFFPKPAWTSELKDMGGGTLIQAFAPGGYEWCVDNWGTKWPDYEFEVAWKGISGGELRFTTAWKTPVLALEFISERFPDLMFDVRFVEEAAESRGHYKVKGGTTTWNLHERSVEIPSNIPEDVEDAFWTALYDDALFDMSRGGLEITTQILKEVSE